MIATVQFTIETAAVCFGMRQAPLRAPQQVRQISPTDHTQPAGNPPQAQGGQLPELARQLTQLNDEVGAGHSLLICCGSFRGKAEQFYRQRQDAEYISDFDREIKRIEGRKP